MVVIRGDVLADRAIAGHAGDRAVRTMAGPLPVSRHCLSAAPQRGRQALPDEWRDLWRAGQRSQWLRQRLRGFARAAPDERCVVQRSEAPTSELQSLMRISYAVYCLKNKH